MPDQGLIHEFEWDQGNLNKSYLKHGITPKESEEIFLDENLRVVPDVKHQQDEPRFVALGKTLAGDTLFVVFTLRGHKVRVISARRMNRKERRVYEKIKKNPQV